MILENQWILRIILLLASFCLYIFAWNHAFAEEKRPSLSGQAVPLSLLEEELTKSIHFNSEGSNTIGHILIDDRSSGINESTWLYIKKALSYYKETKPIFIILELNTPGGEVYAALKISDALKEMDTQFNIPIVCYINNWAISAGAMLAYSCRFITVVKDASMGAAEPILQDSTTGKTESASEKVNSAIRTDFANRAHFFDRDPDIAEAMVDKDIILVVRDGRVVRLDSESQINYSEPHRDEILSPKGKLLTLNAEQLIKFGVADLLLQPHKLPAITESEREAGKWPAEKMLLFHEPFFQKIPGATVDSYRMDWKTKFFVLLANPVVSSLLFLGLMVGFYFEMSTPGFGIAGAIAVTCLFLIVLSSLSLEIANWLEVILLLAGVVIILVEIFVLPSFGLLGFIGIVFFLMGLFGMMLPGIGSVDFEWNTNTWNAAGLAFFHRLAWLSGSFVMAFFIIVFLGRFVTPNLVGFNRFVLRGSEQLADEGYVAVEGAKELPAIGTEGDVFATLRPAGKVLIQDRLYDALSGGEFIEKGTRVKVMGFDGGSIVVTKVKGELV